MNHALLWSGTAEQQSRSEPEWIRQFMCPRPSAARNRSDLVGTGATATGIYHHALLWSGTAASEVDLHPSGFTDSHAYDISGTQQVGWGTCR